VAIKQSSVGIVKTQYADIGELKLESGIYSAECAIGIRDIRKLNRDKSNAVLVFHALTGDAHAAGKHRKIEQEIPDGTIWRIGPKKTFDTNKLFVICINRARRLPRNTTGPSSINPKTKRQYGLDFPEISIRDIVAHAKKADNPARIEEALLHNGRQHGRNAGDTVAIGLS